MPTLLKSFAHVKSLYVHHQTTISASQHIAAILIEHRVSNVRDIMGYFEVAVRTGALSVDDTFWNSLTVEVGKEINMMEVYSHGSKVVRQ